MIDLKEYQSPIKEKKIEDYTNFNSKTFQKIVNFTSKIKGKTIIHINATANGGGVAELLNSQIMLERSLGLDSHWYVVDAPNEFFNVTKKIHNLLQGKKDYLLPEEEKLYLKVNQRLSKSLNQILTGKQGGILMIHDPQPMPLVQYCPKNFIPILRMHIDLSSPDRGALRFLKPLISLYPNLILSSKNYIKPFSWFDAKKIKIIMPAIDPLTDKNRPMELVAAQNILGQYNINCLKPIVSQISRLDPWKDPLGVIKAYYLAKNKIPDLQLILAGLIIAKDDPEAWLISEEVKKHAKSDKDIFLFIEPESLKNNISFDLFFSAIYTASSVMIQKSTREGFGLTITEAMWKGKAVVAGDVTGARLQIENGRNGILVSSPEEAAEAIVELLNDKEQRERLGQAAIKSVVQNFLLPRYILEHLELYSSLMTEKAETTFKEKTRRILSTAKNTSSSINA